MSPTLFLILISALTILAWMAHRLAHGGESSALRKLAREWGMHYSDEDRFQLAGRLAGLLPVPGAADVRVEHLIYGNDVEGYRYLFTAGFTIGALRSKRRLRRVIALRERRSHTHPGEWSPLALAPVELSLIEQYRQLYAEQPAPAREQAPA